MINVETKETKIVPVNVKIRENDLDIIDQASEKDHRTRSSFMRAAALEKAHEVLSNEED
jgi:uncharacterized protein (DUF1778 family)